jgi:pyridoxamine 5'-phosphate oxidase
VSNVAEQLRERDADPDPLQQFAYWFAEAAAADIRLPEAAALATALADGRPSVRMVLVKEAGADGFVFYSNYRSRKGEELRGNPYAALLFYWDALGRQVRVEGGVQRSDAAASAAYVRSRPRASQLSALASPQSRVIESRQQLEEWVDELAGRYKDDELPMPEDWGGFRLVPEVIEFWQHREDRLHDRLRYRRRDEGSWLLERLAP